MQHRQEQVAFGLPRLIGDRHATIALHLAHATVPPGCRLAERDVHGCLFFCSGLSSSQVQVHLALPTFLNANGSSFEFGGSGLGVHGVNGEVIG